MAGITGRTAGYYPYGNYQAAGMQPMPGYGWPMQMQQAPQPMMQQTAPAAQMSKPTVHADIIQIENEEAGNNEPVDAGTSQMMITKDESAILIKSVLANGETTLDIYRRIPKAKKPAAPDYITREEFESRMAEMIQKEKSRPVLRVLEPEEPEIPYTEEAEDEEPPQRTIQRRTTGGAKKR